ncbi:MAG: LysR family transcriptional regulator [Polyangiales bacterium]
MAIRASSLDAASLDWVDLRAFDAIACEGSVAAAARKLRCSHSSLLRRLNQLEDVLGAVLVHRHRGGCTLTPDGHEVAGVAAKMQAAAHSLSHRVGAASEEASGSLCIATVGGGATILLPILRTLHKEHPRLRFELIAGDGLVDLKRGEADLALRLTVSQPPEDLIGVRHGSVAFAAYRHRDDTEPLREPRGTNSGRWIVLNEGLSAVPQAMFERAHVGERRWLRVNSGALVHEAVTRGAGRGVLACVEGDADPQLVRMGEPIPELELELWSLYPRTLKGAPRLRVFRDALAKHLADLGPRLRGEV